MKKISISILIIVLMALSAIKIKNWANNPDPKEYMKHYKFAGF